jgi:F-type H+-transporting ATPase subunit delta
MNMATVGTLSSRYAQALYLYALDNNEEEKIYDEMKYVLSGFLSVPELKKALQNPVYTLDTKLQILETASGGNTAKCLKRFYKFIFDKNRQNLLEYIPSAYLSIYRKAKNIVYVDLITAMEIDNEFVESVRQYVLKGYNDSPVIEMSISSDPDIIGGFILNIDGKQLDLSIKREIQNIRESILKNF